MTRGDFHRGGRDASIDAQWDADKNGQHRVFALCRLALRQDAGDRWWIREERILHVWERRLVSACTNGFPTTGPE